jgi:hypothetical protein
VEPSSASLHSSKDFFAASLIILPEKRRIDLIVGVSYADDLEKLKMLY